jgi:hypothetical protein
LRSVNPVRANASRVAQLAIAIALGFGLWWLVLYATTDAIGSIRTIGEDENDFGGSALGIYDLSFEVGGLEVYYGQTLASAIALSIVAAGAWLLLRRRSARGAPVAVCPHCLSTIPAAASVCGHCTRPVASPPSAA